MPTQPENVDRPNRSIPWFHGLMIVAVIGSGIWTLVDKSGWAAAILLVIATVTTLAALGPHLPLQNILFATSIVVVAAGAVEWANAETGIPFGPVVFGATGPKIFDVLPWAVPALWIIAVFNGRGVARLILRPWRKTRTYGFRLIGLTAAFVAAFDFALEPFATRVEHYWFWQPTKFPVAWHGTPVVDFLTRIIVATLILVFTTPLLINKQLSKRRPPDFHPLAMWLVMLALFGTGTAMGGLWSATAADAVIVVVTLIFAVRGAKW